MLAMLSSVVAPIIPFRWFQIQVTKSVGVNNFVSNSNLSVTNTSELVVLGICTFISFILLFLLASKIIWIYRVKSSSKTVQMKGYIFIETKIKQAPFTFLNNLFWKQGLSKTDAFGKRIFKHELTHIFQKHTYDKLFTQIVCCLFWMNPFNWFIQKELNTIHEFIADAACIEQGSKEDLATMLLYAYNEGSYLSPSHAFFSSSLARRLHMIGLLHGTKYPYLRKMLALPVLLFSIAILGLSLKTKDNLKTNTPWSNKQWYLNQVIVVGSDLNKTSHFPLNQGKINMNKKLKAVTGYPLNSTKK